MGNDGFRVTSLQVSGAGDNTQKIAEDLDIENSKLSILFVSNTADFDSLCKEKLNALSSNVIACSTAGEISHEGFSENTIVGLSLHGDEFVSDTISLENISDTSPVDVASLKEQFVAVKEKHLKALPESEMFCVLLIDGLSVKEEIVTGIISNTIEEVPLVGGSAADGLDFNKTRVFYKGEFRSDIATLTFVSTTRPFEVFKVQHFSETDKKVVITDADPEKRIVREIDGMPAAESYALNLGVEVKDFTPMTFSKHPLMLKIGDDYYVRSIQKVNEDNSLTFYCAIDNGLVLTLAHRENLIENAKSLFSSVEKKIGKVDHCIMFECILRQLETKDLPEKERNELAAIYKENRAVGFHTYGEQYGGLHINQTLTGVAFGRSKKAA